jgi:hypothetical protein
MVLSIEVDLVDFAGVVGHFWFDLEFHSSVFPRLFPKPVAVLVKEPFLYREAWLTGSKDPYILALLRSAQQKI